VVATPAVFSALQSPDEGTSHNELHAVAVAGGITWAVGDFYNGTADRTLIEKGYAGHWSVVASHDASSAHNELDAVAAVSTADAWAVGRYDPGVLQDRALIEHWNGRTWSLFPGAQQGLYHNELDGIAAPSASDVWAVGHYDKYATPSDETLVEHFNGRNWSVVHSPNEGTFHDGLLAVTAVPGSGVLWAVGYVIAGKVTRTLAEEYSGGHWSIVPTPNAGGYHNELDGVAAVSPSDVWAVGTYFNGAEDRTLVEHWDGRKWSIASSPNASSAHNELDAVAAGAGEQLFAVGYYFDGVHDRTLVERFTGTAWRIVKSADVSEQHNELQGVAIGSASYAVVAGRYFSGTSDRTLVLRCDC
jgi:hypothetical protein